MVLCFCKIRFFKIEGIGWLQNSCFVGSVVLSNLVAVTGGKIEDNSGGFLASLVRDLFHDIYI